MKTPNTHQPLEPTGSMIDEELADRPFGTCQEFDDSYVRTERCGGKLAILAVVIWMIVWVLIVLDWFGGVLEIVFRFSLSLFRRSSL